MRHVQIHLIFIIVFLCIVKYRAHNNVLSKMSTFGTLLSDDRRKSPTHLPLQLDKLQYHGTTTLSFLHKDCVVLCIDSKASVGNYVGSRCVKKVFPVSKSIVATMAGGAADCAYWIRRVATAARGLEYKYSASLNAGAIARLLSSSLREYKGQGMCIIFCSVFGYFLISSLFQQVSPWELWLLVMKLAQGHHVRIVIMSDFDLTLTMYFVLPSTDSVLC